MTTLPIDKWIHGVLPGDPVSIVARRSLYAWLGAVQHYLPLAARRSAESQEYILKLRVWSRRASAAVKLYEELLPEKDARWLKKQLRRIRKTVGEARDCDVLAARLGGGDPKSERLLGKVRKKRRRAQKPLNDLYHRLTRNDRFDLAVADVLESLSASGDGRFDDWAREKLRPQVEQFYALASAGHMDVESLHRLRLRTKDLRYTMELLGGAFSADFSCTLYPLIDSMQDRLGEINDLVVELAYMKKRAKPGADDAASRHLKAQMAGKQSHLNYLVHEFQRWCSPQLLRTLRRAFDEHLGDSRPLQLVQ